MQQTTSINQNMEITIERGRGYVPAEENKKTEAPLGVIATDAIYTPVKNVKYSIENYRVEQKTDYEKLVFEIVTDGSIHPKDALHDDGRIWRKPTNFIQFQGKTYKNLWFPVIFQPFTNLDG